MDREPAVNFGIIPAGCIAKRAAGTTHTRVGLERTSLPLFECKIVAVFAVKPNDRRTAC
jgi:hypothetical protein